MLISGFFSSIFRLQLQNTVSTIVQALAKIQCFSYQYTLLRFGIEIDRSPTSWFFVSRKSAPIVLEIQKWFSNIS